MIFGVVILLLALAVAYFHYAQGLFSATLSAIFTFIAAVVAVSYHETVVAFLLKGAVANIAEGVTLVILFVLTYVILRGIFDKTIPGNVRYPLLVDKIGAGLVGVMAGLFATGVLAIAAQALPFGPSIAGYSRYTVLDRDVVLPGRTGAQQDSVTMDEMKDTSFDPKNEKTLFLPVDDLLVGTVNRLSTGALDNDNPLAAIHPDWMTELFAQRVGIQVGAKRVALNLPGSENVNEVDVFKMDSVPEIDAEHKSVREGSNHDQKALAPDKGDILKPPADETLLVVRVNFTANATDEDNKVRFSCASVRLVVRDNSGGETPYLDYWPIGTLEDAYVLYRNKPDDPLLVEGGKSVDFVFQVPAVDVFTQADPNSPQHDILKGVFVEVKRMAHLDLSNKTVKGPPVFSKDVEVIRKTLEQAKRYPKRGPNGETGPQITATGPITVTQMTLSSKLFTKLNPGPYQGDTGHIDFKSAGHLDINHKQLSSMEINASQTIAELSQGDFATDQLYVPEGKKMIQVAAKPAGGSDPWAWTNLNDFSLVDTDATQYHASGAFAIVNKNGGAPCMVANYNPDTGVNGLSHGDEGRPMQIWIVFNVPDKIEINQLQYKNQTIRAQDIKVP